MFCFVLGQGGIGKTTALKHVALSWADKTCPELKRFGFVFHVPLRNVKPDVPLENIIIDEHCIQDGVDPEEIKTILLGEAVNASLPNQVAPETTSASMVPRKKRKKEVSNSSSCEPSKIVLLLLDGYDEYKKGTNTTIDEIIQRKRFGRCWLVLTTREQDDTDNLRKCTDAEAEIKGFSEDKIPVYLEKYLGRGDQAQKLLSQARDSRLILDRRETDFGLLSIPILLNMICVLFQEHAKLPSSRTGVYEAIVRQNADREALRSTGQKATEDTKAARVRLGKLAWQGLQDNKLIFDKVVTDGWSLSLSLSLSQSL